MIDEIYRQDLEKIDDISYFYNIEFEDSGIDLNAYRKPNEDINERLITRAAYNSKDKRIHIFLTERGIESIQKKINKERLKHEIIPFFIHENIHAQQDKGDYDDSNTYKRVDETSNFNDFLAYVTQQVEIDAFARSIAEDLRRNNININTLISSLPTKKGRTPTESLFFEYKRYLDKKLSEVNLNEDTAILVVVYYITSGHVWKRFLKQLYYFLPRELTNGVEK